MRPIVLCFSGFDPTGGAGIQADIEAILQTGAQAMGIITANTVQNTRQVFKVEPIAGNIILAQFEAIVAEFSIGAIKIGMCATKDSARIIARTCQKLSQVPVVLDPVLSSTGSGKLNQPGLERVLASKLAPNATVITPNLAELDALSSKTKLKDKIKQVLAKGCENILLTTTDSEPELENIQHVLYAAQGKLKFNYPRLKGDYHGSGCTLAASLASYLAQGLSVQAASKAALDYTWASLKRSDISGNKQKLPNRS